MREIDKLVKHFNTFNTRLPPTRHCLDNSTMHFMENSELVTTYMYLQQSVKRLTGSYFTNPLKST